MKRVVIGMGYGDEGKGLIVDWLARKNPQSTIIRYSGGHQVGHCVRTEGKKHIFSNFGSGTLAGLPTIWRAKTCDPIGIWNEHNDLMKKFPEINPKLYVDPNCPVTTPFDKAWNRNNNLHGSIGVGFGATIQREEDHYHLTYGDLRFPSVVLKKLQMIESYYREKGLDSKIVIDSYQQIFEFLDICKEVISLFPVRYHTIGSEIYESSQGLMLDMDYGYFPFVTRSKLGLQEIGAGLKNIDELYFVTRAYQTRHGKGPLHDELIKIVAEDETNVCNEYQGEFKVRALNIDELNYVLSKQRKYKNLENNLVITCLDQLKEYKYVYKGKVINFTNEEDFLDGIILSLDCTFENIFLSYGPTADDIITL